MITRMTRYTLLCPSSFTEDLIGQLQEAGVMDIKRSHRPVDAHSAELLEKAGALKDLAEGTALKKELSEARAEADSLQKELCACQAWGPFKKDALEALTAESGCTLHFHIVSEKAFDPAWAEQTALQEISRKDRTVLFVTVVPDGEQDTLPGAISAPRSIYEVEDDVAGNLQRTAALEKELLSLPEKAVQYNAEYRSVMAELDAYLAKVSTEALPREGTEGQEQPSITGLRGYLDIYEGFAPTEDAAAVNACLDKMPLYYVSEQASGDDTPIKLHNNWFARQFEVFTEMYGWPSYGEFDPTPVLAPFYLLFFSMCLGDAGYGIILMLIAGLLHRRMPGSSLGKMHSLIFLLGAGTFVVGTLFGTFFGISLFEASWVPSWLKGIMINEGNLGKIAGFDPQIILSLAIGVFHICLAMIIKTACFTVRDGFKNCLSTWGWTLLVVGGVTVASLAIGGLLGGAALKWTVIVLGALSALGIFIFNDIRRNPLVNIGAGLWDTYSNVTGILSDVLSYVRLYALGLAGGMLGGVFNSLALMILGDNPTWHWLPFVIMLLVGHGLNIALSCLGAFVHPLRLNFVEYFKNAGYEGKGVGYKPLSKTINN